MIFDCGFRMAKALLRLCSLRLTHVVTNTVNKNCVSTAFMNISRNMATGKKMVNGVELFYDCRGSGSHALVCIPGALGTARSDFTPQADYFGSRDGFQIITFDPRGYGHSRPPQRHFSGTTSFENDAKDAKSLMDAFNIIKFSVFGWSDGAIAGLILAALFPDSVRSLVVWGGNAYVSKEDIECYDKIRDLSKWSKKMLEPLEQEYGRDGLHQLWNSWLDVLEEVYHSGGNICKDMLSKIKCPTLILHGMKDPIVPNFHPTYLAANISSSSVYNFPDGKHNIHLRYSEEFNEVVENFVRKI